ncbi:glycosyltransferase family 4 protein [Patulibacter sp. SYSU D01012]|uniref:glycosyltransferase family 4 protein n=1 Tax=Patulibacter sp. SYSU D01012 TaxID=2817381 RepID=UPI001B30DF6F|nr:glycosyltransferase family 4 protein [Patulibacter sp. SYSU D01012]
MPSLLVVHAVDRPGDAERALLRAAPALVDRGWRITMTGPSGRRPPEAPDGVAWRRLGVGGPPGVRGAASAPLAFAEARALAAEHDVVLLDGPVAARLLPALRGAGLAAASALVGDRLRRRPAPGRPPRTVLRIAETPARAPRGWAAADALVADSAATATAVGRAVGRDVRAVGRPVLLEPPPVVAPWAADERPVVGFVGPLEPRTAPLDLVAAADRVRDQVPRARIVFVGEHGGSATPRQARLLARRATAAGLDRWAGPADAPGLLRHLDVLVCPARAEAFPTRAAQAQALGVPVVATAVGGHLDVVDDGTTGRLVPPADPDSLAHGIVWALRNGPFLVDACRRSGRRFAVDAVADRLHVVLDPASGRDSAPAGAAADAPAAAHPGRDEPR